MQHMIDAAQQCLHQQQFSTENQFTFAFAQRS